MSEWVSEVSQSVSLFVSQLEGGLGFHSNTTTHFISCFLFFFPFFCNCLPLVCFMMAVGGLAGWVGGWLTGSQTHPPTHNAQWKLLILKHTHAPPRIQVWWLAECVGGRVDGFGWVARLFGCPSIKTTSHLLAPCCSSFPPCLPPSFLCFFLPTLLPYCFQGCHITLFQSVTRSFQSFHTVTLSALSHSISKPHTQNCSFHTQIALNSTFHTQNAS